MLEPLSFTIRPYQPADREEVTAIAQRLVENGIPPWRDPLKALDWHNRATQSIFEEEAPGDAIYVAAAAPGRLLKPGGVLLLSFHCGTQTLHLDEWWGKPVSIDFNFYEPPEMQDWLARAGFGRVETHLLEPYPGIEHQSKRAYLFAYPA